MCEVMSRSRVRIPVFRNSSITGFLLSRDQCDGRRNWLLYVFGSFRGHHQSEIRRAHGPMPRQAAELRRATTPSILPSGPRPRQRRHRHPPSSNREVGGLRMLNPARSSTPDVPALSIPKMERLGASSRRRRHRRRRCSRPLPVVTSSGAEREAAASGGSAGGSWSRRSSAHAALRRREVLFIGELEDSRPSAPRSDRTCGPCHSLPSWELYACLYRRRARCRTDRCTQIHEKHWLPARSRGRRCPSPQRRPGHQHLVSRAQAQSQQCQVERWRDSSSL